MRDHPGASLLLSGRARVSRHPCRCAGSGRPSLSPIEAPFDCQTSVGLAQRSERRADMGTNRPNPESAAELLARWRASGRDVNAAQAAAVIAAHALEWANAAQEAASETEKA